MESNSRKIEPLPPEILQQLVFFCEANNIGFAQIGNTDKGMMLYILGSQMLGPNEVAIIAADMLLQGVIGGYFYDSNEETLNQSKPPGSNVN